MDSTPSKYAYRCLPLTIMNQTGWWIYNPVGFTAMWTGEADPGKIILRFDNNPEVWSVWVNDQFGQGIVTWNTPFLFRTRPAGSRLLICGPANQFKHGIQPLMALIESDWMTMSFTMNWKFTAPGVEVRFEVGEPLFQAIPLAGNVGRDLEAAEVKYEKLWKSPEVANAYHEWNIARKEFHNAKTSGAVRVNDWQKDYFRGNGLVDQNVRAGHMIKIVPPTVHRSEDS